MPSGTGCTNCPQPTCSAEGVERGKRRVEWSGARGEQSGVEQEVSRVEWSGVEQEVSRLEWSGVGARVLQEDNTGVEGGVVEHEWSGDAVGWQGCMGSSAVQWCG